MLIAKVGCTVSSRGRVFVTAPRVSSTIRDKETPTGLFGKHASGAAAERRAAEYLERAGLKLIERNYRTAFGEIDLIMQDRSMVVFVEVRYRVRDDYGSAAESVDRRKQARLRATAEHFLQHDQRASNRPCRFDIVAIAPSADGDRIEWLRDAF